jgi:hypothetical protein
MAPRARIEHCLPGRLRVRYDGERGDEAFFERLVGRLGELAPVREVHANPGTGSVLILHDGPLEGLALAAAEDEPLHFLFDDIEPLVEKAALSAVRPGGASVAAGGVAALALVQLARGQAFGPVSESLWHANLARGLGRPGLAAALAAVAAYQLAAGRLLGSASSLLIYALLLQSRQQGADRR